MESTNEPLMLCCGGVPGTRKSLMERLSQFGTIVHCHYFPRSTEAYVFFSTREEVLAAAASSRADSGIGIRKEDDAPLYFADIEEERKVMREKASAQNYSIAFPMQTVNTQPIFSTPNDSIYDGLYEENMLSFLDGCRGILEDEAVETLILRFESLTAEGEERTVSKVAQFQIEVGDLLTSASNTPGGNGENVVLFPEYLEVWRKTMTMVANNEMTVHIDRFAETIGELLGFLDKSKGELSHVHIETE